MHAHTLADLCSGITPLCLTDDMKGAKAFNTTCRVLPDDSPCGDDPDKPTYCNAGICYCESLFPDGAVVTLLGVTASFGSDSLFWE